MTFKKAMLRGALGFPLGVFISTTITVLISVFAKGWGGGYYSAATPLLIKTMGSELNAVVLQYILSGVLGFAFAAGSAIWEVEKWSITKQTVFHFAITSVAMFPIAYICHWVGHNVLSIVIYFAIFLSFYLIMWIVMYSYWKKQLNGLNKKIKNS